MRLKESVSFQSFLTHLFNFLEKNQILSCLYPADDLEGLKTLILNSEYLGMSNYYCEFTLDFRIPESDRRPDLPEDEKDLIAYFIMKNDAKEWSSLLIDLNYGQRPYSWITFYMDLDRPLFFFPDFNREIQAENCVSQEEFERQLAPYCRRGEITWVQVD